jgi:surface antigen
MRLIPKAALFAIPLAATLAACTDDTPTAAVPSNAVHYVAPAEPVNGEFIRQNGTPTVYLALNHTLYGIPDQQTLRACTGSRENVVRTVASLPSVGWSYGSAIPSAGDPQMTNRARDWLFGDNPVKNSAGTVFLVVGCVKSGIQNPDVYNAIFNSDWSRIRDVPDADLNALPTGPIAQPYPLRRAGTLLESGGTVRWVTYHGGSLGLDQASTMDSYCRAWSEMTSNSADNGFYAINGILQPGPGPGSPFGAGCVRGDDYPFKTQSYGTYRIPTDVDPWKFYYRECTSFVAWRLNQNGIPFTNSYLQPPGYSWGSAWLWDDAALRAHVKMDHTPEPGAVAQWDWGGSNGHVAYVAAVKNDGTVVLEEYNYNRTGRYGDNGTLRYNVAASSVHNFIHFR